MCWPSRLGSNRSSWLRSATGSRRHATEYRYGSKWMMLRNWTFILTRQEYLNCTALEDFPIFSFSNKKAGSYNSFCPHFCLKKKYIHLDLRSELRKAFDWVFKWIVCQCYLSTRYRILWRCLLCNSIRLLIVVLSWNIEFDFWMLSYSSLKYDLEDDLHPVYLIFINLNFN